MLSDHSIRSFDDLQRLLHGDSVGKWSPPPPRWASPAPLGVGGAGPGRPFLDIWRTEARGGWATPVWGRAEEVDGLVPGTWGGAWQEKHPHVPLAWCRGWGARRGRAGRRCLGHLPNECPGVNSAREGGVGRAGSLSLWPGASSARSPGDTWPRPAGGPARAREHTHRRGTCSAAHTWRGWRPGWGMYL